MSRALVISAAALIFAGAFTPGFCGDRDTHEFGKTASTLDLSGGLYKPPAWSSISSDLSARANTLFPSASQGDERREWLINQMGRTRRERGNNMLAQLLARQASACESHWLTDNEADGKILELEDGSLWKVDDYDAIDTQLWLATDDILVCGDKLLHVEDGEQVDASRLR